MKQEYIIDKELKDMLISWFDNIEDISSKLTSGNVSHQGAMIRNKAIRCSNFIKEHCETKKKKYYYYVAIIFRDTNKVFVKSVYSTTKDDFPITEVEDMVAENHLSSANNIVISFYKEITEDSYNSFLYRY